MVIIAEKISKVEPPILRTLLKKGKKTDKNPQISAPRRGRGTKFIWKITLDPTYNMSKFGDPRHTRSGSKPKKTQKKIETKIVHLELIVYEGFTNLPPLFFGFGL